LVSLGPLPSGDPIPEVISASTPAEEPIDPAVEQDGLMTAAETFEAKGLYDQAVDQYLELLQIWPDHVEARARLQKVYVLMAKAAEPEKTGPTPEEMRAELERELREQMKKEIEEQTRHLAQEQERLAAERQGAIDQVRQEQDKERQRLQQEMESKLLEEIRRSKREEELRQQLQKELEEKQKMMDLQREKMEAEKVDAFNQMKSDLEKAQRELEQKVREQVETEIKDRAEREAREREKQAEREAKVQELLKKEQEERRRYEEEKKVQANAQVRVNREITDGLERLRREKEKESSSPSFYPAAVRKTAPVSLNPVPPSPASVMESFEISESIGKEEALPSASAEEDNLEDPFVRQTLADIYAKQGLFVEAVKIYEKILNDEPDNEEVRNKLRNVLKMKGL